MSRSLFVLFGAVLLLGGCSGETSTRLTTEAELDKFLSDNDVVLLDFTADWCPPCQHMKPIVRQLEKDYHGRMAVAVIDVDAAPKLARKFDVSSIPAFFVLQKGEVKSIVRGAVSRGELEAAIKKAL